MKKRIVHLIPTLDRAGAQKQMSLLARGLPSDEYEVHVCALTRGGPLSNDLSDADIPVTVIGKRWPLDPQAYWNLHRYVARRRPDLIHSWLFAARVYGHAVSQACRVKCHVVGHRCVDPRKGGLELAVDRFIARRCRAVVANSPGVRNFYAHHGLPAEKIRVISNGIPPAQPSDTTRRQLLDELGLPQQSRLIGLVGGLCPQKRVKDAIWSADLLKVIHNDVHLLILGDGPQGDRLRKFRDQVAIRDKVHFLGHREDVARIMPHFNVFWSTSAYEGQPNAVMEAMAAGVPVVATDIPGNRDLVVDEKTGCLVPVGSRAEIARRTNGLLEETDRAKRFGHAGRQQMQERFGVETMIQQYVRLYREVLGGNGEAG